MPEQCRIGNAHPMATLQHATQKFSWEKPQYKHLQVHEKVSRLTFSVKVLTAQERRRARWTLCWNMLSWLSSKLVMSVKQPGSYGIFSFAVTVVPGRDTLRIKNPKEERRKLWDWLNTWGIKKRSPWISWVFLSHRRGKTNINHL